MVFYCFCIFSLTFLKRSIAEPDDLSKYDFLSFASINFQNGEACKFSRVPLVEPLLSSGNDEDRMVRFLALHLRTL